MLTALLLVLASRTQSGDALPDATALLDRREAALGTVEARAKVRGIVFRGRVEMAGTDVSASFEERHLLARDGGEKVLHAVTWEGWGTTTQGTDGTVSWSTDPGFGIMVKEGASQGPPRRLFALARSAPWRTLYAGASTFGKVTRDGRAVYQLEMRPREGAPEFWYLDVETNELARVALVFPGPTGERLPMEFAFGEWKAVDGVVYPHRRVQEILGAESGATEASAGGTEKTAGAAPAHAPMMSIVYHCESIAHAELAPADVAPPPEVAEAIADPKKRAPAPTADATKCTLEEREPATVAAIRLTIPADRVSATLAQILPEVSGVLTAQGLQPTGPPFSRYHRIDTAKNEIDLEAGIPVRGELKPTERVQSTTLPGGTTAVTWHVGAYHDLPKSYARLEAWIAAEKHTPRGPFWEIYWTDPSLEPDPSSWRTQILWPVE